MPKSWPGNRFSVRKHCSELAVGFAGPLHLAHTTLIRIIVRNPEARTNLAAAWFVFPRVFVLLDLATVHTANTAVLLFNSSNGSQQQQRDLSQAIQHWWAVRSEHPRGKMQRRVTWLRIIDYVISKPRRHHGAPERRCDRESVQGSKEREI